MVKCLDMIVRAGAVGHVFYPVFPPDRNASDVVDWLAANPITVNPPNP